MWARFASLTSLTWLNSSQYPALPNRAWDMSRLDSLTPLNQIFTMWCKFQVLLELWISSEGVFWLVIWCRICMPNYYLLPCQLLLCRAWEVQEWEGVMAPLHPWVVEWACQCHRLACHQWGPINRSEIVFLVWWGSIKTWGLRSSWKIVWSVIQCGYICL